MGTICLHTADWRFHPGWNSDWLNMSRTRQLFVAHFAVHLATRAPIYHNLQPHYLKQTNQTVKRSADACAQFEEIPPRSILTLADGDAVFVKHIKAAAPFSFKTNWPLTATFCAGFVMTHRVKRPQVQKVSDLPENYLKTIHLLCPHEHKMPDVALNPSSCGSSRIFELLPCRWGFKPLREGQVSLCKLLLSSAQRKDLSSGSSFWAATCGASYAVCTSLHIPVCLHGPAFQIQRVQLFIDQQGWIVKPLSWN